MKQNNQVIIRVFAVAVAMVLGWQGTAFASTAFEERMTGMEQRVQRLEQTVQVQKQEIKAKDLQITELEERQKQGDEQNVGGWFQGVSIVGAVEIEAFHTDNAGFSGNDVSDINVATAEVAVEALINDWTTANLVLLWEEDDGGDNNLRVEEATITIANQEAVLVYFTAGRTAVPFGRFETHMVSDPFTIDLGEAKETFVVAGLKAGGLYASACGFNGDIDDGSDSVIDNGGVDLGFSWESDNRSLDVGVSYINDIGDTEAITDAVMANLPGGINYERDIHGYAAHAMFSISSFSMIGEYVTASAGFDATNEMAFNGRDAEPSAWNMEAGFTFDIAGRESKIAVGYQETDEALGFGLPESRVSAALSVAVMENTTFSIEWVHDEDYSSGDSALVEGATENGTGADANTVTAQLAIEF
jgi:hypothetical protein